MSKKYTAVIHPSGEEWAGWVREVAGVECRAKTRKELVKDLRTALVKKLEQIRSARAETGDRPYEESPPHRDASPSNGDFERPQDVQMACPGESPTREDG